MIQNAKNSRELLVWVTPRIKIVWRNRFKIRIENPTTRFVNGLDSWLKDIFATQIMR